jgi:hypothetical protein
MQRLLVIVLAGAVATGCLALMPVSSHIDRGADFTRYRTYAWGPADALPVTDARLRENPSFIDDLHGAIDRALQARGLERATEERADLLVHFHAAVTERLEVPARLERFSERVGTDRPTAVTEFEAGTLVIDLVDTSTKRVVWRGWAEHRLEDLLDDPPEVKRRVEEAVHRLMERLPLSVESRVRVLTPEIAP